MKRQSLARRWASPLCLVLCACNVACRYAPTEVMIHVDSDLGTRHATALSVTVRNASMTTSDGGHAAWTFQGDHAITLPSSFAVVPAANGSRDGTVTMLVELQLAAEGTDQPAITLRRTARFRFVSQRTLSLPVFLPLACGSLASGCTSVAAADCTVTVRCEEQGLTCGNDARCTPIDMTPMSDTDASVTDTGPADAYVPPSAPRPLQPSSNSALTAGAVVFSWVLPPAADGARVELCSDRSCSAVTQRIDASGTHSDPVSNLAAGLHWWRVRSRAEGAFGAPSPAWPFTTLALRGTSTAHYAFPTFDGEGDGFADAVIGNPDVANLSVYRGGAHGLAAMSDLRINGANASRFGATVAAAGDVNGDGFGDIVVGAPMEGRVYVFHGSATGLASSPNSSLPRADDTVPPALGMEVSSAGDIDADGYADILIASGFQGAAVLYRGGPDGITGAPITIVAPDHDARFGTSVGAAGDVNGDGFADVIIGAFGTTDTVGYAAVFGGTASGGLTSVPSATLNGTTINTQFGQTVAGVGDMDGDGLADIAIGEPGADRVEVHSGDAVAFVRPTGITLRPPATVAAPSAFGISVSRAGDFNGDGFHDVLVGAQAVSMAFVFPGGTTGVSTSPSHRLLPALTSDGSGFGRIVGAAGDVDGDGRGDVLVGVTTGASADSFEGTMTDSTGTNATHWWSGPAGYGFAVLR